MCLVVFLLAWAGSDETCSDVLLGTASGFGVEDAPAVPSGPLVSPIERRGYHSGLSTPPSLSTFSSKERETCSESARPEDQGSDGSIHPLSYCLRILCWHGAILSSFECARGANQLHAMICISECLIACYMLHRNHETPRPQRMPVSVVRKILSLSTPLVTPFLHQACIQIPR